eukprot:gene12581-14865_t
MDDTAWCQRTNCAGATGVYLKPPAVFGNVEAAGLDARTEYDASYKGHPVGEEPWEAAAAAPTHEAAWAAAMVVEAAPPSQNVAREGAGEGPGGGAAVVAPAQEAAGEATMQEAPGEEPEGAAKAPGEEPGEAAAAAPAQEAAGEGAEDAPGEAAAAAPAGEAAMEVEVVALPQKATGEGAGEEAGEEAGEAAQAATDQANKTLREEWKREAAARREREEQEAAVAAGGSEGGGGEKEAAGEAAGGQQDVPGKEAAAGPTHPGLHYPEDWAMQLEYMGVFVAHLADPVKPEALNEEFHNGYLTKNVVRNLMSFYDKGVKIFRMIVDVEAKIGLMIPLEALGGEVIDKLEEVTKKPLEVRPGPMARAALITHSGAEAHAMRIDQGEYGVLAVFTDEHQLVVYPGSHKVRKGQTYAGKGLTPVTVHLNAKSVLIFSGRLVHGGAEFKYMGWPRWSVHFYIDMVGSKPENNVTFPEAREGSLEMLEEASLRFHEAYGAGIFADCSGLNHHRRKDADLLEGELKPVYGTATATASASIQAKGTSAKAVAGQAAPATARAVKAAPAKQAATVGFGGYEEGGIVTWLHLQQVSSIYTA